MVSDDNEAAAPTRKSEPVHACQVDQLQHPEVLRRIGALLRGWCAGRSDHTLRSRFGDLRLFAMFLCGGDCPQEPSGTPVRAATMVLGLLREGIEHAEAVLGIYIDWMAEQDYAATTKTRRISTLHSWARYLHTKRAAPCDLSSVPRPRFGTETSPARLPSASVQETLDHLEHLHRVATTPEETFLANRDKTVVVLVMLSFVRRRELLQLDWSDVDDSDPTRARFRFRTRDGRQLWRDIGHIGTQTLARWTRTYESRFGPRQNSRPLIVGLSGRRLGSARLYAVLEPLA